MARAYGPWRFDLFDTDDEAILPTVVTPKSIEDISRIDSVEPLPVFEIKLMVGHKAGTLNDGNVFPAEACTITGYLAGENNSH